MFCLSRCFAFFSLLITAAALAQEQRRMELPSTKVDLGGQPARISMDTATKHCIVAVKINGTGPYPFVLDTAAGGSVIDSSIAEKLKLEVIGQARVGDATGGAASVAELVQWETTEIGAAKFSDCWGVVRDLGELFRHEPDRPMGILGFRLFSECLLTLDYPNGEVVLELGALPEADGRDVLAMEIRQGLPHVTLDLVGKPLEVDIDSGAAFCLVLAEASNAQYPLKAAPRLTRYARRMNTKVDVQEARIAGELAIGRHRVQEPTMHSGGVRSVIGYDVLSNFAVTFDQKSKRVRFARDSEGAIKIPSICYPGFGVRFENQQRVVDYVIADSPAGKAGLREGDVIERVNAKVARELGRGAWRKLIETPGKLEVDALRDGKALKISIEVGVVVE